MTELIKIASMRGNLSPELGYIDIRVDRASVLGNPFELTKEEDRNKVCDAYDEWLLECLAYSSSNLNNSPNLDYWKNKGFKIAAKYKSPTYAQVRAEFQRLVNLIKEGNKLRLSCWCQPKPCHADSIKKEVLRRYNANK